jgi:small-conductance mechanosensitive channel
VGDFFSSDGTRLDIVASAVVLLAAFAVRFLGGRYIRKQLWSSTDESRTWLVRLRNVTLLLTVVALLVIWADELRAAALPFLALGVALVIATKELIMSMSGSVLRATSGSFTVGDRIKVGDLRGVVIDHSLLVTTMLEIGPTQVRTGRIITVPNSVFVATPVANESRGHGYVLHSFTVPVKRSEFEYADKVLSEAAASQAEPYIEEARAHMTERARRYSLSVPIVEPIVLARPASADTVELTVRLPVAARDVWQVENSILRSWLSAAHADSEEG